MLYYDGHVGGNMLVFILMNNNSNQEAIEYVLPQVHHFI